MSFEIVYTDNFERELKKLARKYRSIRQDLKEVVSLLEKNSAAGTPIGKNCYKIRMAISSKRKGKSGGARIITHLHIIGETIYLLSIYDKSERDNITDNELESLLKNLD